MKKLPMHPNYKNFLVLELVSRLAEDFNIRSKLTQNDFEFLLQTIA